MSLLRKKNLTDFQNKGEAHHSIICTGNRWSPDSSCQNLPLIGAKSDRPVQSKNKVEKLKLIWLCFFASVFGNQVHWKLKLSIKKQPLTLTPVLYGADSLECELHLTLRESWAEQEEIRGDACGRLVLFIDTEKSRTNWGFWMSGGMRSFEVWFQIFLLKRAAEKNREQNYKLWISLGWWHRSFLSNQQSFLIFLFCTNQASGSSCFFFQEKSASMCVF